MFLAGLFMTYFYSVVPLDVIFPMKSLFFPLKTDDIWAQDQIYKWVIFFVLLQRGLLGQEYYWHTWLSLHCIFSLLFLFTGREGWRNILSIAKKKLCESEWLFQKLFLHLWHKKQTNKTPKHNLGRKWCGQGTWLLNDFSSIISVYGLFHAKNIDVKNNFHVKNIDKDCHGWFIVDELYGPNS